MLSNGAQDSTETSDTRRPYSTRNTTYALQQQVFPTQSYSPAAQPPLRGTMPPPAPAPYRNSPAKKGQKHVVFQLVNNGDPRNQGRLPMRVMISQKDDTKSIIETVKNFWGLYEHSVEFHNDDGPFVPAYDNFANDMVVHVWTTVLQPSPVKSEPGLDSMSPKKASLGPAFEMRPSLQPPAHSPTRSGARSAGVRSLSPQSDIGKRSASVAPGGKPRPNRTKSKDGLGDAEGYSSGDNGEGSVASSRRSKAELVNAEISVENIVEGGRRKRAFESSQLPLFVPPQVPATSISSMSPQRRAGPPTAASPYLTSNQQTFSYSPALPSPQSYGGGFYNQPIGYQHNGFSMPYQAPPPRQLRGHAGAAYQSMRSSTGGILPTPDPTVGSVRSDEDAARSLLRLSDAPFAFSLGRTSTSTHDDAFSGKADAASSDEEDEDDEEEDEEQSRLPAVPRFSTENVGPQRKKQRLMNNLPSDGTSGEEYEDRRDGNFDGYDGAGKKSGKPRSMTTSGFGMGKSGKPRTNSLIKPKSKSTGPYGKVPMSPSSMPAQSRKGSIASTINFQNQLGDDEEDLSSKPRCQRCRKSKKGCDRQRPCGRCKDAGIGADGCVSEEEGEVGKKRFGRFMGVPVKKGEEGYIGGSEEASPQPAMPAGGVFLAPAPVNKDKKRKR